MIRTTRTLLALTLGLAFVGCNQADSAPADDAMAADAAATEFPSVPSGATLTFTVVDEISTKSARAGDSFSARLVSDFIDEKNEVVLPAGIVMKGTVTKSLESPGNDQPAVLELGVGSLETAGSTLIMVGDIEELQIEADAKDTDALSAGKVAAGAAAGAIVGKIAGGTNTGAAVGAAGGAALAIATRDGHATIPAGSRLVVRLTNRLSVR
jgi:hypothetical protein